MEKLMKLISICLISIVFTGFILNGICLAIEGCELLADTYSGKHYPQQCEERYFLRCEVERLDDCIDKMESTALKPEMIWFERNVAYNESYSLENERLFYIPLCFEEENCFVQCRMNNRGGGSELTLSAVYLLCKANGKYIGVGINSYLFYGGRASRILKEFEQQFLERTSFNWRNETSWVVKYLNPYTSAPFPIKLYPDIYY